MKIDSPLRKILLFPIVWIFLSAMLIHFCWAIFLIFFPASGQALALSELYAVIPNRIALGLSLISASLLAGLGIFSQGLMSVKVRRWVFSLCLLPQQFFLIVNAAGGINRTIFGDHKAIDIYHQIRLLGLPPTASRELANLIIPYLSKLGDPRVVLASQIPIIVLALCHLGAMLSQYKRISMGI